LLDGERIARKSFSNTLKGFEQLAAWMRNREVVDVHVCMEATGGFHEALALFLSEAGYLVSVVNPSCVKAFGQSELSRTKTDKVDAALIARFCRAMKPEQWIPPSKEIRTIQALLRRLEVLQDMRQQELNRFDAPTTTSDIQASIATVIAALDEQIKAIQQQIDDTFDGYPDLRSKRDLLTTIPGIGKKTAANILAELPDVFQLKDSRAAVSYAGLAPAQYQSGKGSRPTRMSKIGNARLRRCLFMPALVAMRHNPALKFMTQRLLERGKPKMVIVGALMRKLLALSYAILRSGQPYCSELSAAHG
jgi:transposase